MFFLLHSRYQVLWADDGVRLRRALNALLERAYAKRQVGFGWNEFVGSKLSPSILVLKTFVDIAAKDALPKRG